MSEEILKVLEKLKNKSNYQRDCNDGSCFIELFVNEIYILCKFMEDLQQKVEQLENIIDVKKYDCDYLETLFSKSSKEEVLKAYTYKCEQLEKVMKAKNEFEMKAMQLENIRKEAIRYMKSIENEPDADMYIKIGEYNEYKHLLNILKKGE